MTADLRAELEKRMERLRAAREQLQLDANLAALEVKKRWEELEPRLEDARRLASDVGGVSRRAVGEIFEKVARFRRSLHRHAHHRHPLV